MVVSESYLLDLVVDKKFFGQPLPELINLPGFAITSFSTWGRFFFFA